MDEVQVEGLHLLIIRRAPSFCIGDGSHIVSQILGILCYVVIVANRLQTKRNVFQQHTTSQRRRQLAVLNKCICAADWIGMSPNQYAVSTTHHLASVPVIVVLVVYLLRFTTRSGRNLWRIVNGNSITVRCKGKDHQMLQSSERLPSLLYHIKALTGHRLCIANAQHQIQLLLAALTNINVGHIIYCRTR